MELHVPQRTPPPDRAAAQAMMPDAADPATPRVKAIEVTSNVVFLLGMPRSGTKLLRDLLNRNDEISILPHETHFFPGVVRRLHKLGDVTKWKTFSLFYADLQDSTFFRRMSARGLVIKAEDWFQHLQGSECRDVLVALFECYRRISGCRIVGDKTPSYITQVSFLADMFPAAKYIQIVRDPRDFALSMKSAWSKNIPRAVQRWKQDVRTCRADVRRRSLEYAEVRYEDLLQRPERTLQSLCAFLGVQFDARMLSTDCPTENLGNARGAQTIVRDNFGQWQQALARSEVRTIERIAGALMTELGYSTDDTAGDDDVGGFRMSVGRVRDVVSQLRFTMKEEHGFLATFRQLRRVARYR